MLLTGKELCHHSSLNMDNMTTGFSANLDASKKIMSKPYSFTVRLFLLLNG